MPSDSGSGGGSKSSVPASRDSPAANFGPVSGGDVEERERELREFVENAGVPLQWVGEDGTILWANRAELKLLGYPPEEYIGRNIAEFHLDRAAIDDILRHHRSHQGLEACQAQLRRKDGSRRYVSISSSVYRKGGRFVHARCVTLDVTEQKKSAEVQERLAAIVESSEDAIISKDLHGIIQSWNPGAERIFGYTSREMVGQHISKIAPPEHVDEIPGILSRIARGERVDHFETRRRTKDGRILTVSLTISPIRDATGAVIGASKVARDVTERVLQAEALQAANDALRRANSDLEHFAYSASHDLQEPLRMVATYSELLQQRFAAKLGPTGEEFIAHTVRGAMRMEALLRDLRTYAQISTAEREPKEDLDAGEVLKKALGNLETAIAETGAEISSTELPRVRMYEFQLGQVFQNLIGNAIRYRGSAPPRIHVAAQRQGPKWLFSVQDNGIGIDSRFKEQIFGVFKRLHTSAEYPGTGMGLAICQRVIERIGGRIWVESEPGRGSTFFFTVPCRESERNRSASQELLDSPDRG